MKAGASSAKHLTPTVRGAHPSFSLRAGRLENREAQVTLVTVPTEIKGEPAPTLWSKKERLDWPPVRVFL